MVLRVIVTADLRPVIDVQGEVIPSESPPSGIVPVAKPVLAKSQAEPSNVFARRLFSLECWIRRVERRTA